jgi:hypothetical protein
VELTHCPPGAHVAVGDVACATDAADTRCWGWTVPDTIDEVPSQVLRGPARPVDIASPLDHAAQVVAFEARADARGSVCALSATGDLRCSGYDQTWPNIRAFDGDAHTGCAVDRDGCVWCWGVNDDGQAGRRPYAAEPSRALVTGARALAGSTDIVCTLDAQDALWCWADSPGWHRPFRVELPALSAIVPVPMGVCGLQRDGLAIHCLFSPAGAMVPRRIEAVAPIVEIGGGFGLLARERDGTVRQYLERWYEPHALPALRGATSLAAVTNGACGIRGGEIVCDGYGPFAAEGTAELGPARAIFSATQGACALRERGSDCGGSFGDRRETPSEASGAIGWASMGDGRCWWTASGELSCVGLDRRLMPEYELGPGNPNAAVRVIDVHDVVSAFVDRTSCALTRSGEVWCWGETDVRGDGSRDLLRPTEIVWPRSE